MSVLIKGMEMPENCHVCVAGFGGCCFVAPPESHGLCPDEGRADFCPLVPVPDHGRLIDADAFIKQKTEQICENCDRRRGMKDGMLTKRFVYAIGDAPCRACDTGDMLDYVDDAPTIIPADGKDTDVPTREEGEG